MAGCLCLPLSPEFSLFLSLLYSQSICPATYPCNVCNEMWHAARHVCPFLKKSLSLGEGREEGEGKEEGGGRQGQGGGGGHGFGGFVFVGVVVFIQPAWPACVAPFQPQ